MREFLAIFDLRVADGAGADPRQDQRDRHRLLYLLRKFARKRTKD
jgi:hypothetical protein